MSKNLSLLASRLASRGPLGLASIAVCSAVLCTAPGRASAQPSCGWVNSIGAWSGAISWSWSLSDRDLSVNYVTASVKR